MSLLNESHLFEVEGVPTVILAGNYHIEDDVIMLIDATFINDTIDSKCHARFKVIERGGMIDIERIGASVTEL